MITSTQNSYIIITPTEKQNLMILTKIANIFYTRIKSVMNKIELECNDYINTKLSEMITLALMKTGNDQINSELECNVINTEIECKENYNVMLKTAQK